MAMTYKPFPDVADWPISGVSAAELDQLGSVVDQLVAEPPAILKRALDVVKGLAAIETGAIENLYELDRGFTISAAMSGAVLESLRKEEDLQKHALIEGQLAAYDSVLDLATGQRPIAEAWIRELHAILCRGQGTYTTYDEQGNAHDTELKKGAYKTQNNHVQTRAGIHCYTPAIDTAAEMARLVWNVTSEPYAKLRAFDQAAYMHYAFVAIHPFADGNGRVARALTSIPTYKHYRVPILITLDQRDSYFAALAAADDGRYDDFRIFIRNRIADSIVLLAESVRLAKVGTPEEATVRIARNYETRGGYAHVSVDEGGDGLLVAVYNQLHLKIADDAVRKPGIQWSLAFPETDRPFQMPEYRRTLSTPKRFVQLEGKTGAPAHGSATTVVGIVVPSDAAADDVYVLECGDAAPDLRLEIPIRDVLPKRSMVVEFRVTMFADRVLTATADALAKAGHATLKKRGYLPGRE